MSQTSPETATLVHEWQAEAKKHALAALDGDCEVGDEEWCLHRESARIYRKCADQLEAILTAGLAQQAKEPVEQECFDMLWQWFTERRGAEDMRANATNGGLSAEDFKQMLDEHEANLMPTVSDTSTVGNTVAEPSRCKNTVARGESKEAGATTGDAPVASASTPSWQMADARLRSIVASARGNAKAAKIKDDDLTWQAHAREVERVAKMLRGLIGKEPADVVGSPKL